MVDQCQSFAVAVQSTREIAQRVRDPVDGLDGGLVGTDDQDFVAIEDGALREPVKDALGERIAGQVESRVAVVGDFDELERVVSAGRVVVNLGDDESEGGSRDVDQEDPNEEASLGRETTISHGLYCSGSPRRGEVPTPPG